MAAIEVGSKVTFDENDPLYNVIIAKMNDESDV